MSGKGAFYTGEYRNLLLELGYSGDEIQDKVENAFNTMFHGPKNVTLFHDDMWPDMAPFEDTGNVDARTEGMSYAMMMCVQLDKKVEFDKLWKWSRTFMWHPDGKYKGYFAWSCGLDGHKNAEGPAPDGEEYYAMALFFASHRWGDGEGIFNYSEEAKAILRECVHKGEPGHPGDPMWNPENYLIKFVPESKHTDPSYHLPHFYELFALWADECDRDFWKKAADASRKFLHTACHPVTGLAPEYSNFNGSPTRSFGRGRSRYYSDAYRVTAAIGLDTLWFDADPWQYEINGKLQKFFCETEPNQEYRIYQIDGKIIDEPALHPVGITATNAQASLASVNSHEYREYAKKCVDIFWNTPLREGIRRYYDNCLYMFSLLALSGNYRIW